MSPEKDNPLSEKESLQLIANMIETAKGGFHDRGISAIMWGSVVAIAGFISFAQRFWNFSIGFDIWLMVLAAIIPQIIFSIKEKRERKAISHSEAYINAIWMVYAIAIFALVFYTNVVPAVSQQLMLAEGEQLFIKTLNTNTIKPFAPFVWSASSLFLLLYSIPTLTTGLAKKFKPMILGGVVCIAFFIVSCFTASAWDMLLCGFAGIFNWLIPGIILRKKYLAGKAC